MVGLGGGWGLASGRGDVDGACVARTWTARTGLEWPSPMSMSCGREGSRASRRHSRMRQSPWPAVAKMAYAGLPCAAAGTIRLTHVCSPIGGAPCGESTLERGVDSRLSHMETRFSWPTDTRLGVPGMRARALIPPMSWVIDALRASCRQAHEHTGSMSSGKGGVRGHPSGMATQAAWPPKRHGHTSGMATQAAWPFVLGSGAAAARASGQAMHFARCGGR